MSPTQLVMPPNAPSFGDVRLRAFEERDADMLMDLSTDPYLPKIGSLPSNAGREEALAYIERQHGRLDTGAGYSFCIADKGTDAPDLPRVEHSDTPSATFTHPECDIHAGPA